MNKTNSQQLYKQAREYIPGGVNSPVRAFSSVGGEPLFIKKGKNANIWDVDDNKFIDFCMSWGALILGHAHERVINAVKNVIDNGTSFGACTELEIILAKMIADAVPSIEQARLVNSGTEAVMSAVRLARAWTCRNKIIKFDNCYHGHADYLLVKAGSGLAEMPKPSSLGVPNDFVKNTISIPFNNLEILEKTIKQYYKEIACVIIEPVCANYGLMIPENNFLQKVREITAKNHILLIFDEVITGFRLAYGGAQEYFNIKPDLTCLGKIIGGGFPVGALGGKKDIMQMLAPVGYVYQAGTLSGNPVAVTAGIETLNILKTGEIYKNLKEKSVFLKEKFLGNNKIKFFESMFSFNFEIGFKDFYLKMLDKGIYLSPSQYETNFISNAHSKEDLEKLVMIFFDIFNRQ